MVQENIAFLLGQFLRCPAYKTVIFCWVMHQEAIIRELLSRLDTRGVQVRVFTLLPSPAALEAHIQKDVPPAPCGSRRTTSAAWSACPCTRPWTRRRF